MIRGPRFRLLADAVRYVSAQGETSAAIRRPDGHWHQFDGSGRSIIKNRRSRPRTAASRRLPVAVTTDGAKGAREIAALVLDHSDSGVRLGLLDLREALVTGSFVRLASETPVGVSELRGEVVWARGSNAGIRIVGPRRIAAWDIDPPCDLQGAAGVGAR